MISELCVRDWEIVLKRFYVCECMCVYDINFFIDMLCVCKLMFNNKGIIVSFYW